MLNVAIIGAGYIGSLHAQMVNESEKVNLVAIVERNEEVGKKAAKEYECKWYADAREMLENEEIDMVDVCLPTFLHEEYVLLAAEYKKHVLCEKPVALSVEVFDRMQEATKKAGVRFMVAQSVRFSDMAIEIKKRYDAGEFGQMKMVYANRLTQHPAWANWHRDPALSGGGLYDLHIHDVDFARYLFGPVKRVYAIGYKNDDGCYNHVISSLTFVNGVQAAIEGAYEMTEGFPFSTTFRLTGAGETIDYTMRAGVNIKDAGNKKHLRAFRTGKQPKELDTSKHPDSILAEIEHFADCIEEDRNSEIVPLDQSRAVLVILDAIQQSMETGQAIDL
ncbi:MAG: Gfo/Idh/MocA family oxidoreductase [Clostridia bacterium]|nr:Gfo/Idh/MocA family oxidoreductase [Clostridia bacterium]